MALYKEQHGEEFKFFQSWTILRNAPRFQDLVKGKKIKMLQEKIKEPGALLAAAIVGGGSHVFGVFKLNFTLI